MEATHHYHFKGLHKALAEIFALKLVQFIQSPIKLLQSHWASLNNARCSVLMRFTAAKRTTYAALPNQKNCAHSFSQFGNVNLTVQCFFFFYFRQQWNQERLMHERFPCLLQWFAKVMLLCCPIYDTLAAVIAREVFMRRGSLFFSRSLLSSR